MKNEVKRLKSAANGFLEGSTIKRDGKTLIIKLIHGGEDILKDAGCDKTIDSVLFSWFGVNTDVLFTLCEKAEAARAQREKLDVRKPLPPVDERAPAVNAGGENPVKQASPPAPRKEDYIGRRVKGRRRLARPEDWRG